MVNLPTIPTKKENEAVFFVDNVLGIDQKNHFVIFHTIGTKRTGKISCLYTAP